MRVTESGFAAMTMALRNVAEECCHGRMAMVTEGGYELKALEASLDAVVRTLDGAGGRAGVLSSDADVRRGRASADGAARALKGHWTL